MMVTLKDIAEEAGVSIRTASMVLRGRAKEGRISDARAASVRAIAQRLRYRPDAAARAMRSRRTGLVGVLVQTELAHTTPSRGALELATAATLALDAGGYATCLVPLADVLPGRASRARIFRERLVDGLIVVNAVPDTVRDQIIELVPHVIWVDHNRYEPTCCIRRDEAHVGQTVVRALHRRGYRKLLYVRPLFVSGHYSEAGRRAGVEAAARELGMTLEEFPLDWECPLTEPPARLAALDREWAIVAYSDRVARDVLLFCGQHGLRCGRDFAIAACDSSFEFSGTLEILARAPFDREAMGRRAGAMMLRLLDDPDDPPRSELIPGEWLDGTTTPPIEPPPASRPAHGRGGPAIPHRSDEQDEQDEQGEPQA